MASKRLIEKELVGIKRQLKQLSTTNTSGSELLKDKAKAEETSSSLLSLMRFILDENRKRDDLIKGLSDKIDQLYVTEEEASAESPAQEQPRREVPLSDLDTRIIQFIQVKDMACADDIRAAMNYRGRNAACSRLNGLYKRGILQRYQLGHKVYYKYDAGKTTHILIVSPPHIDRA